MSQSRPNNSLLPELITALKGHIRLRSVEDAKKRKEQDEVDKLNKLIADIELVEKDVINGSESDIKSQARIKALLTTALVDAYVHEERGTSIAQFFLTRRRNVLGPRVKAYQDIIVTPLKDHNFLLPQNYYTKSHDTNEFVEIYLENISDDPQIIQTLFHLNLEYFVSAVTKARTFNDTSHEEDKELMVSIEKVLARMSADQLKLWNDLVKNKFANNLPAQHVFLVSTGADGKADTKKSGEKDTYDRLTKDIKDAGNSKNLSVMKNIQDVLNELNVNATSDNQVYGDSKVELVATLTSSSFPPAFIESDDVQSVVPQPLRVSTQDSPKHLEEKNNLATASLASTNSHATAARAALLNSITAATSPHVLRSVSKTSVTTTQAAPPQTSTPAINDVPLVPLSVIASSPKNTAEVQPPVVNVAPLAPDLNAVPVPPAPALDATPVPPPAPPLAAVTSVPKAPLDHLQAIQAGAKLKKVVVSTAPSVSIAAHAVESAAPTPPPISTIAPSSNGANAVSAPGGRDDLLEAIRKGAKLRKAGETPAAAPKVIDPQTTTSASSSKVENGSASVISPKLSLQEQIAENRRKKAEATKSTLLTSAATTVSSSTSSGSPAKVGMFGIEGLSAVLARKKKQVEDAEAARKNNAQASADSARPGPM